MVSVGVWNEFRLVSHLVKQLDCHLIVVQFRIHVDHDVVTVQISPRMHLLHMGEDAVRLLHTPRSVADAVQKLAVQEDVRTQPLLLQNVLKDGHCALVAAILLVRIEQLGHVGVVELGLLGASVEGGAHLLCRSSENLGHHLLPGDLVVLQMLLRRCCHPCRTRSSRR